MKEICGDISSQYQPGWATKLAYLAKNLARGVLGCFARIPSRHYRHPVQVVNSNTVGRQYLDDFLKHSLPVLVPPGNTTILDVGCGDGYLRSILAELGYSGKYVGLDVVRDKKYKDSESSFTSTFVLSKIEEFETSERFDLVVSNTALEHIEDDVAAIDRCKELTAHSGVQVHIVPSFFSLFAYLLHGYRQYNPKRIRMLFANQEYFVWKLGGLASFILQVLWCTIPERLTASDRMRRTTAYRSLVRIARRVDMYLPVCSLFYVVVVRSKYE